MTCFRVVVQEFSGGQWVDTDIDPNTFGKRDQSTWRERGEMRLEIIEYLQDGPKTAGELSELAGRKVYNDVARMLEAGEVEVVGKKKTGRNYARLYAYNY